jgi:hypothetical protein
MWLRKRKNWDWRGNRTSEKEGSTDPDNAKVLFPQEKKTGAGIESRNA